METNPSPALNDTRHRELSRACCIEDVLCVTRDYLRSWTREELERLPTGCFPRHVRDGGDIEIWADRLTHESAHAALFQDDERLLDRLTSHFLIASVRIRQLA
jgi:hypothetical protein